MKVPYQHRLICLCRDRDDGDLEGVWRAVELPEPPGSLPLFVDTMMSTNDYAELLVVLVDDVGDVRRVTYAWSQTLGKSHAFTDWCNHSLSILLPLEEVIGLPLLPYQLKDWHHVARL